MKRRILVLFCTLCFISCSYIKGTSDPEVPKIQVKLVTITGVNENRVSKDTVYFVDSDYFEIGLYSMENGARFTAQRDIRTPKSVDEFELTFLFIADSTYNPVSFNSSTDFLNFMLARGYEMKDQQKFELHTDYTFIKRK